MRFDIFVISTLGFIFMITAGLFIINDQRSFDSTYQGDNTTFANMSNSVTELEIRVAEMKNATTLEKGSSAEVFSDLLNAAKASILVVLSLISVPADLIGQVAVLIGLPQSLLIIISMVLIILFLSGIIYMFFRFQPR